MEKKVFRVGSVGIGGISRGVHLPGIHKSPDLELVAVCDLKPERMEYARKYIRYSRRSLLCGLSRFDCLPGCGCD